MTLKKELIAYEKGYRYGQLNYKKLVKEVAKEFNTSWIRKTIIEEFISTLEEKRAK